VNKVIITGISFSLIFSIIFRSPFLFFTILFTTTIVFYAADGKFMVEIRKKKNMLATVSMFGTFVSGWTLYFIISFTKFGIYDFPTVLKVFEVPNNLTGWRSSIVMTAAILTSIVLNIINYEIFFETNRKFLVYGKLKFLSISIFGCIMFSALLIAMQYIWIYSQGRRSIILNISTPIGLTVQCIAAGLLIFFVCSSLINVIVVSVKSDERIR
jgi:hypothetical protein